jgi:ketosteroid isomerase-like protein
MAQDIPPPGTVRPQDMPEEELTRYFQAVFDACFANLDLIDEYMSPDMSWEMTLDPEHGWLEGAVYRGPEGVRRFTAEWADVWDEWSVEVERAFAVGDRHVVCGYRQRGRAKVSGVPVEMQAAMAWTFGEDGKAVRMQMFGEVDDAVAAVSPARG